MQRFAVMVRTGLGRSEKARWLNSWTVAGRWNIDQEDFISNINAISYLTLRGSYGLNANYGAATNSLAVLRTQLTNRPYLDDRQLAIDIEDLENAATHMGEKIRG